MTLTGVRLTSRWLCACKRTTDQAGSRLQEEEQSERLQRGSENTNPGPQPPFTRCDEASASNSLSQCPPHPAYSDFITFQTSRPQSLKKPLATLDSRKVTVRELRVTSVTVTSPGLMMGLQTSSGFPDAGTSSGPREELHSSVLSCPERDRNMERGRQDGAAVRQRLHQAFHMCAVIELTSLDGPG